MPDYSDDICRKCGRCCCEKFVLDGTVYYMSAVCEFLDPETKLCTIYEDRHERHPDCLPLEEGIRQGVFPADCPYVKDLPDYKPPVMNLPPQKIKEIFSRCMEEDA